MKPYYLIRPLIGLFICIACPALAEDFKLDSEIQTLLANSGTTEDGGIYNMEHRQKEVADYVRQNWRLLLANLEKVPTNAGNIDAAAMLIGRCAEDLPPIEYLDFFDAYLDAYSKHQIRDQTLVLQLCGLARKKDFLSVNWEDHRVQSILKRAEELAPRENSDLHALIKKIASGSLSDMYFANSPTHARPPETLPGIKLRPPFESLLGGAKRPGKADQPSLPSTQVAQVTTSGNEASWFPMTAAILVLLLALGAWRYFKSKGGTSARARQ